MAERRAPMIRNIVFNEAERSGLTFSDSTRIRLDSFKDCVTLKEQTDGFYPTTANLYVMTAVASPNALRKFIGFQAAIRHYKVNNVQVTSEGFRLYDGTNQYWWNGSAWAINTSNWNTEAEIAANILTFTPGVTARKFAVVVNLATTDRTITPQLLALKVGFEAKQQSWVDDIFIRSLVRDLSANLRPISDVMAPPLPSTQSTVDVGAAVAACGVPFTLVDVDSIYNQDTDPNLLTNLLQSFNPGTGIATLTGNVNINTNLRLLIIYQPQVIVLTTNPDFVQLDKLPAVVIEQIRTVGAMQVQQSDDIINKTLGTGKQLAKPFTANLDFDIRAIAPGDVDLLRLVEQLVEFADNFTIIRSDALDEGYRLQITDEFDANVSPQASGVCEATAAFRLHNVTLLKHVAVDTFLVKKVKTKEQTQNQTTPAAAPDADATTGAPPLGNPPQQ